MRALIRFCLHADRPLTAAERAHLDRHSVRLGLGAAGLLGTIVTIQFIRLILGAH